MGRDLRRHDRRRRDPRPPPAPRDRPTDRRRQLPHARPPRPPPAAAPRGRGRAGDQAMSATSPPRSGRRGAGRHAVPVAVSRHARQIAAQLSTLFEHDIEIASGSTTPTVACTSANEQLCSGLAPDAFGLIHDGDRGDSDRHQPDRRAASATAGPMPTPDARGSATDPLADPSRASAPTNTPAEQRRQLAIDVGELSQQLTQALCAAGWSADQARHANVHQLARPESSTAARPDRRDYAAERPT